MALGRSIVKGSLLSGVPRHPVCTAAKQRLARLQVTFLTGQMQSCLVEDRHRLTVGIHSRHGAHVHVTDQGQQQLEACLASR